jgi:hypothetical protein
MVTLVLVALLSCSSTLTQAQPPQGVSVLPVPPQHRHTRMLLENALRYIAPETRMIDPQSGYPYEGWNHDPHRGLFLRSFTQLTAIGQWMEVLANVAAGYVETPELSRAAAMAQLAHITKSLRHDQADPRLSAHGLLVNFMDLSASQRQGPLGSEVDKQPFLDVFGDTQGEAIWHALQAKGWITARQNGREASIQRGTGYGWDHFDGPLTPYSDTVTKEQIMSLLDQRVVLVVFGDNANLSAAVAKAIGALLAPSIRDNPQAILLRDELEQFLVAQETGYARLYDSQKGLFSFGWEATRNRRFGWDDIQGNWHARHMDYLVNEFRGPLAFVVLRYGFPVTAVKNLGFTIKPYRRSQPGQAARGARQAADIYTLAPWDGSAFQALGLSLSMRELENPAWRRLLETVVAVELDFGRRHRLPGFLSESYTGHGIEYSGRVGIPSIAVTLEPRITEAASLYTLGVAYSLAPASIEAFLGEQWPLISQLLTDHGPWEGFNVARGQPIQLQTAAHTLSLILGLLGTSSENMRRYLDAKGLTARLGEIYVAGERTDLLADGMQIMAKSDQGSLMQSRRKKTGLRVQGDLVHRISLTFGSTHPEGLNLSGGMLRLRYRSGGRMESAVIGFKRKGRPEKLLPQEIVTHFEGTSGAEAEIQVVLPATPGLHEITDVVITHVSQPPQPLDLVITSFTFTPLAP